MFFSSLMPRTRSILKNNKGMQKGVSCLGKRGEKLPPVPRGNRGVCARKQETEVQSCLEYIFSSLLGSASEPGAHTHALTQIIHTQITHTHITSTHTIHTQITHTF